MKKVFSFATGLFLLTLLLTTSSCKKADITVLQNLEEYEYCVPASQFDGTTTKTFTITQSQIQAAFASAGVSFDKTRVKALKLSQITALIATNAVTFNQIGGCEVYVKGPNTQGNGTQVAYINNIGNDVTSVELLLNGTDIKDLLNETSITITFRVTAKAGGNPDMCIKLTNGVLAYTVSAE